MSDLRFAIFGTGFWSRFQLAAWNELEGVKCVALYNRTRSKAERLAAAFGIEAVYDDPEQLLSNELVDFVDIITDVTTHPRFVDLVSNAGIPVICQKPMAPTIEAAREMVSSCRQRAVPFYVHENFRWQSPVRRIKHILEDGAIGAVHRARLDFISGYPVFENQPFLRELDEFILTDVGTHMLDVARFLFGEATSLCCTTSRVHQDIRGEDVATVLLHLKGGATAVVNLAYAGNAIERDAFPQPLLFIEGSGGSLELASGCEIRITTDSGTVVKSAGPPRYEWIDPDYEVVHASIVACNENLLNAIRGTTAGETSGEDNLKTLELVFGAYESAASGNSVTLNTRE